MSVDYTSCPFKCGESNGCEGCNPMWPKKEEL